MSISYSGEVEQLVEIFEEEVGEHFEVILV